MELLNLIGPVFGAASLIASATVLMLLRRDRRARKGLTRDWFVMGYARGYIDGNRREDEFASSGEAHAAAEEAFVETRMEINARRDAP